MSVMKTYKIFTSGKMGGLTYRQQMEWRAKIEALITSASDKAITFIHPPMFYQYKENDIQNDIESRTWEINQLIDSDIVVVDLTTISNSIGTHIELGLIEAVNRISNKNIYVVGIGKPNIDHPWISMGIFHSEDTLEEAADYIINYLLV